MTLATVWRRFHARWRDCDADSARDTMNAKPKECSGGRNAAHLRAAMLVRRHGTVRALPNTALNPTAPSLTLGLRGLMPVVRQILKFAYLARVGHGSRGRSVRERNAR